MMAEFWEDNFIEKQEMWGLEPSQSALLTKDFFYRKFSKKHSDSWNWLWKKCASF